MRIGIFTDCYEPIISGVAVSLRTLKNELENLGHEVFVITNDHENAEILDSVLRLGGKIMPMKGMHDYRWGKASKWKVEEAGKLNLDIVHCHTEFTMGRVGRKVARKYNIPFVHTYHTMYEDYVFFISRLLVLPLRFASKIYSRNFADSADDVVFPTIKVKRKFDEYGYKGSSHIVPTGIYMDRFDEKNFSDVELKAKKKELGISEDDFVLLFLGRMSREKSVKELIYNVAKFCKKHQNVRLLLVGGGPDLDYFKHLIEKHDFEDMVTCTGMVSNHDVGIYYRISDLFVNFSMTETQGITYYEALASNLPVLAKYDDNLEGIIENNENGFTFTNDEEFLPLLDKLYMDKSLLKKLSNNARASVEKYSAQNYAASMEKIYLDLLKKE